MVVWAGIVTFNPDIERLRENVLSIIPQVDRLLIFDNGSNNISDVLGAFACYADIIENSENVGMAKALNRLAREAYAGGASDIVLLDQDSVAAPNIVEAESSFRTENVGLVGCLIEDRNVEKVFVDPSEVFEVKRAITSGSMVNLSAWEKIGGYDESLFVDWVDNEFCDNLRFHGYRMLVTHATRVLHEMGRQEYAWSAPGKDYSGTARRHRGYYRQNYPAWRWRDRARGEMIAMAKYRGTTIMLDEALIFIRGTLCRILLLENNKIDCLRAVWDGVISALKSSAVDNGRC